MSARRSHDGELLGALIAFLLFTVIVAGGVLIRLAIVNGDWKCFFSQDPAICVAVTEAGQ